MGAFESFGAGIKSESAIKVINGVAYGWRESYNKVRRQKMIMKKYYIIAVCALCACSNQFQIQNDYVLYTAWDRNSNEYKKGGDSLYLYKNDSFKFIDDDHVVDINGIWKVKKKQLILEPENFRRYVDSFVVSTLHDSVIIEQYDVEWQGNTPIYYITCYFGNDSSKIEHFSMNSPYFKMRSSDCDSIKIIADDAFVPSYTDFYFRPVIIPQPNTHYIIHSRFTHKGFFVAQKFYFKKRNEFIYAKWLDPAYHRDGFPWLKLVKTKEVNGK